MVVYRPTQKCANLKVDPALFLIWLLICRYTYRFVHFPIATSFLYRFKQIWRLVQQFTCPIIRLVTLYRYKFSIHFHE